MKNIIIVLSVIFACLSCDDRQAQNEKQAEECALHFAQNFFNFNFDEALDYCSEDSKQKIAFYVSNISRADIDSIRNIPYPPTISIKEIKRETNDSSAYALCELNNVYILDSLGCPGRFVQDWTVKLHLVVENGIWKVRMANLLQSEK